MNQSNQSDKKIRRNWHLRHDPDFKRKVAIEYLEGNKTTRQIAQKYGTVDFTQVAAWARALKKELKLRDKPTFQKPMANHITNTTSNTECQELLRRLELASLKVASLETLIDIAEEQLGISIRKKYGTKQS